MNLLDEHSFQRQPDFGRTIAIDYHSYNMETKFTQRKITETCVKNINLGKKKKFQKTNPYKI